MSHFSGQCQSPLGLDRVAEFLAEEGRPKAALCSISLCSPRPQFPKGFADFNAGYAAILKSWDLMVNGINPVARTNASPVVNPPNEPVLYGFAFTGRVQPTRGPRSSSRARASCPMEPGLATESFR